MQFLFVIFLMVVVYLCGVACGTIKGCNRSVADRTRARMEEREQIRRHDEEDRRRESERIQKIADDKQRHLDDLSMRDRLLGNALKADSLNRNRDTEIRSFALREVPSAWNTLLSLRGEVNSVNADLAAYRQRLTVRGVFPDEDSQYVRLKTIRNAMVRKAHELEEKLDAAYMESLRAEIAPGGSTLSDETRNGFADAERGVSEVISRYHEIGGGK